MYWFAAGLGSILIIAPFIFHFSDNPYGLLISAFVGIILLTIGGSELFYGPSSQKSYR